MIDTAADALSAGGYGQVRWTPGARFSLNGGARFDYWDIVDASGVSPWVQARWTLSDRLTIKAASGLFRQAPDLERGLGPRGNRALVPERAWHFDVGAEGDLFAQWRWQVNGYDREERDITRLPGSEVRVVDGELVRDDGTSVWRNALEGHSRGVELVLRRDRAQGFSGWVGYALTYTRYRDRISGEEFWGDYDQRHTFNAWGKYRFSNRLELSGKLRIGSNFPLAGYYREARASEAAANLDREDRYFVSDVRNEARLPLYARLDVRANYAFNFSRSRLTLFVEIINLLNRANYGPSDPGFINPLTFRVNNLVEELFPFLPSAGILWEF
jgi:outer membrane receptor protein involved in Fe transport